MSHVTIKIRLRPVRFAFLVRPDDRKKVLEILRINTCLWGGKYNPIIPCFKQVPKWWDRHGHRFETAPQIINGYLDYFEPDFIVEAEPALAEGLGFDKNRVLELSSLLPHEDDQSRSSHGLSILNLYTDLYRREFQFSRRHKHNIVNVLPKEKIFSGFCACLFGAFPTERGLAYLKRAFMDAFEPKTVSLDGPTLAKLYRSGFTSALRISYSKVKVRYHDHGDPALFILDAHEPRDLIDYWNLRAIRRQVIPIPVQWLGDLSEFCKEFIVKSHRPLPDNPHGVMIRATTMFSRSIPTSAIDQLYKDNLAVDKAGANVRQDFYPPFWHPSPTIMTRDMRPTLSASEKSYDLPVTGEKPEIRFDCLPPDFADEYGNPNRWANVVQLRDWSHKDQIATSFPCDYKNPNFPRFCLGGDVLLPTTEGLVIFPRFKTLPERWDLLDGTTAINNWLKVHKIKATPSASGRSTQQIIQTMEGFWGVRSFAHAGIVKLLNKIARKPLTRSIQYQEFSQRIKTITEDDIWRGGNFENLVARNAVELGIELKCTKCESWNWYSLNQLDYEVACNLCLRRFGFPVLNPKSSSYSKWAYRVIGPFALPNYANGGYAASLSIRFFAEVIGQHLEASVTWSAGQELELGPNQKVEVDFILWFQKKVILGNDYPTELIFGEAKSFRGENSDERRAIKDAFQQDDVDRMKQLAIRFPGSILVFSTMKQADELSKAEVKRISKLAEWGREYIRERRETRAPVIILTGTELFTPFHLEEQWKKIGGKHSKLIEPAWISIRLSNLRILADLTQQLYLNMPSYGEWSETKWKKRAARRKVRATDDTVMLNPSASS